MLRFSHNNPMQPKEYYQHPNSPLRSQANFVAHLTQVVDETEITEQVWMKIGDPSKPTVGALLSAPFFAYGYSLLDTVEVDHGGQIARITEASGRSLLRVFLAESIDATSIVEQINASDAGTLEWMNRRYVCVDCPNKLVTDAVWQLLESAEASGELEFEAANVIE